ncbi:hypothetical protein MAR_004779, partial [Mya arenaria]
ILEEGQQGSAQIVNPAVAIFLHLKDMHASVETVNEVENNQSVHYGISRENQSKIKQMFIDMKDSIDIDGILDRFIQDGDLTEDAQERIMFNNPRRKQRNAFDRFVQYMREDECLVHIADQLQKGIKLPALETARLKPHEIRLQIEHHMEDILREIEPDEVAEYFMVYEVCEVNEYEEVVSEKKTTRAKGLALLHLLILNHIPSGYQVFLTALRELNRTGLLQKLKKRHISTPLSPSGYSLRCTRATQCDEEDLVANFRSETVKAEINRRLIPETNTMLYDTISGSLIFHLKWTSQAWRQLSVDRLREVVGTVVRILMEKGNKEDTESQTWNVEVCAIPSTLNVRSSTTEKRIVPKDFYTSIRSKMPDDNTDANDAYQVPECTGTIGHWWLLSAIRKYIVKLIFCEGFVVNSRERVMPERLGPTRIPCAGNAGYAYDAEVLESSEVRKNDD